MKELEFIKIIKSHIGDEYIGDDCAYLKDLGIVVTQDSLVQDVHFKREWITPRQLGYKSVAVNISDIFASGAKPAYVTIALSLPNDISNTFISEFYQGAKSALHGAEIVGGDITGSEDKIFISVTAIGNANGRNISSRAAAKPGYKIIVSNNARKKFGLSSKGLHDLMTGKKNSDFVKNHLEPELDEDFSVQISKYIDSDYAMMDTSDGLADALFKIAKASNVSILAENIDGMFGAEDYYLVAAVPQSCLEKINEYSMIASVINKQDFVLKIDDKEYKNYDELGVYNHFKE